MLSENDLIYFGAMLLRSKNEPPSTEECINIAKEIYKKIFNEEK